MCFRNPTLEKRQQIDEYSEERTTRSYVEEGRVFLLAGKSGMPKKMTPVVIAAIAAAAGGGGRGVNNMDRRQKTTFASRGFCYMNDFYNITRGFSIPWARFCRHSMVSHSEANFSVFLFFVSPVCGSYVWGAASASLVG